MRVQPRAARTRAGITLTEILISIMIMAIGLLSLATLFPIGLMRIREATRASRSALLIESASNELATRNLLNRSRFSYVHDPFRQEVVPAGNGVTLVLDHSRGKGLPVAYDPLWWAEVGAANGGWTAAAGPLNTSFGRFANGLGYLRNDPTDGAAPSAHGLQRITNFPDPAFAPALYAEVERIFASTDDIVYQTDGPPRPAEGVGSPLVPDLSAGTILADLSFTWMFTGRQADVTNGSVFEGDIVVFHNRPFAVESLVPPFSGGQQALYAQGERVYEAVFGYGGRPVDGYSSVKNTVLIRWPSTLPDPEVRVGGWIADVTYERSGTRELSRFLQQGAAYPAQRCHWYRVARRSEPQASRSDPAYREMVVTLATQVRARTYYDKDGIPQVNAALVSPFVVNVVPAVVHSR